MQGATRWLTAWARRFAGAVLGPCFRRAAKTNVEKHGIYIDWIRATGIGIG